MSDEQWQEQQAQEQVLEPQLLQQQQPRRTPRPEAPRDPTEDSHLPERVEDPEPPVEEVSREVTQL